MSKSQKLCPLAARFIKLATIYLNGKQNYNLFTIYNGFTFTIYLNTCHHYRNGTLKNGLIILKGSYL